MRSAALFPGQGSQYPGMGQVLPSGFAEVRCLFETASEMLGWDLWAFCTRGDAGELNDTRRAQPAIFTLSYALFRVLTDSGWGPDVVAGHSLGEFTAATAAGAFSFADGVRAVAERGRLMAEAARVRPGTMLALLGAGEDELAEAVAELSRWGTIAPANYNCPGQVVVALERGLLERARVELSSVAKRVVELPVSGGFHSPLMAQAQEEFSGFLERIPIVRPSVPILLNVPLTPSVDPAEIREALISQMTAPVRWQEAIGRLLTSGVRTFVEVGPKDVLARLVQRISAKCRVLVTDGRDPQEIVSQLRRADES